MTYDSRQVSAYDSRQIANDFLHLAEVDSRNLSIMTLLKLVYIAHGWSLALRDQPLITDFAQAWKHGPVVPSVYYAFRPYGVYGLQKIDLIERKEQRGAKSIISQTYKIYGHMAPFTLSSLTHIKNGPWDRTRRERGDKAIIPNEWIQEHYKDKARRAGQ